jgi:RNA polymerase sigma factor FliA
VGGVQAQGVRRRPRERGDRLSLVDTLGDKGAEDPVAVFEWQELEHILAGAINRLGEREKIVG